MFMLFIFKRNTGEIHGTFIKNPQSHLHVTLLIYSYFSQLLKQTYWLTFFSKLTG